MKFTKINQLLVPNVTTPCENTSFIPISHFPDKIHTTPRNPGFHFSTELQDFLQGKQLLFDDLPFPIELIQQHYENGFVSYRPGIAYGQDLFCNRCGNEDSFLFSAFHCARCHSECFYCRKCITMGRISQCTPLVSWIGPEINIITLEHPLKWSGQLSLAQQTASTEVVKVINENREILCWAVCGAGKTEVLFDGIAQAILNGKRVCLATPRTDVVIELVPRMKAAFPHTEVIALYGGSEDRHKFAPLTLSTTHQLLRFYRAFDVVIIDEADAFPYSSEPMLEYAVQHSKKPDASTVYLSATPSPAWQHEVKQGKRHAITIPARYHKRPLPVPTFKWCGNWRKLLKKKQIPAILTKWILNHLSNRKQAFLFIPHVHEAESLVSLLKKLDSRITAVYSEDQNRKEKVTSFRQGEIPILITTTILERGVTVPNIDVAVLGAEDAIFTESALVQISGRVGRSASYPTGDITFFHYGKTKAMIAAKTHIEDMNKEGFKRNLLIGE
ncbi:DEAD/DEAH box helicase [Litchfieldia salsa]|uniref:Competence protein ComFA n=1 Tax=Litchfieldia salsa TaxID=930152 RepID=A0A1H0WWI3_9BACI|nr:DEAD/DEAH box helicase [Litchfieldia salsa]SDP95027.1 competence protein ComFA [Litchfieldia salsa]